MGKRSEFERVENDFYPTPYEAVIPLIPHLTPGLSFMEPCAGDGRLINHLERAGLVFHSAFDINPQRADIARKNCLEIEDVSADMVITNPPWDRPDLHRIIHHFRRKATTWLLFDADWMHTIQAMPFLPYCSKIISVGRVKWIEDSASSGMDNVCWYQFQRHECVTEFVGRRPTNMCEKTESMF